MDLLDKSIILELMFNSRMSCQDIAEKYNSSRGVVRKRIRRLQEIGVIEHFTAWYSFAMIDANFVFGHIITEKTVDREKLLKTLEQNPMIHVVIPLSTGDILIHALAVGVDGLSNLGASIRKLRGVNEADLHLIRMHRGKKVDMKDIHLRVMGALFKNSRISMAEIARRAGLSPRRVRRVLDELVSGHGVVFGLARNPALGSGISFYLKIVWDDRKSDAKKIMEWLRRSFPRATWEPYISASAPVMFTRFIVEHIIDVEIISNALTGFEGLKSVETLIFYPARISSILTRERLKEDILSAGYEICFP